MFTVYACDISIHSPFHMLNAYSIRVWHLHPFSIARANCLQYTCLTSIHSPFSIPRVKCLQYAWVTSPSIPHSTCKMHILCMCDISIHSPFDVLTAYSIRVWQFHPFSIPRVNWLQHTCMTSPSIVHSWCWLQVMCNDSRTLTPHHSNPVAEFIDIDIIHDAFIATPSQWLTILVGVDIPIQHLHPRELTT